MAVKMKMKYKGTQINISKRIVSPIEQQQYLFVLQASIFLIVHTFFNETWATKVQKGFTDEVYKGVKMKLKVEVPGH